MGSGFEIELEDGEKCEDDKRIEIKCSNCGNAIHPRYKGMIGYLVACTFMNEENNYPDGYGKEMPLKFYKKIYEKIEKNMEPKEILEIVEDSFNELYDS